MPVAERMDLSSLCCRSKCRGERFISSSRFAGCGWMGWDDSLCCKGLCGRNVRLSAGKSYLASGAAPLAWFLTLPGSQCMSRCSFRGSTGCWNVTDALNCCEISLVTPVLGVGEEPIASTHRSWDLTVRGQRTGLGSWISASKPNPQVDCISFYLPQLKWSLFSLIKV